MKNKSLIFWLLLIFSILTLSAQAQDENANQPNSSPKKSSAAAKPKKSSSDSTSSRTRAESSKKVSTSKANEAKKAAVSPKKKLTVAALEVTVNQSGSSIEISRIERGVETEVQSAENPSAGNTFAFNSLKPGEYLVKVRKGGFYDEQVKVTLRAGITNTENVILKPSVGTLKVITNANAEIQVENSGNAFGQSASFTLSPQTYQVLVSADGYESVTQTVKIEAGENTTIGANLKLITPEKLLRIAETDYQTRNYKEAIANCRLALAQNPDLPQANLLMGYSYFYTDHPRESRFYLARALGLQTEVEIPVSIYQKENNSEILTDGVLKINRNNLSFYTAQRPELNFTVSPASIGKLEINQDKNNSKNPASPKPDSIEIKALISSGKKTEKKNLRLFPRQAFARVIGQNKAEIVACTGCVAGGDCVCQTEIHAIYELLLNWRSGSYPRPTNAFSSVAPPSANLIRFDGKNFSLNVPDNWLKTSQTENSTWFAPNGGFFRRQNQIQYVYAVSVGVVPINNNDLKAESERFYRAILSGNSYLEQQSQPKEISIAGRKALAASFAGFGVETQEEEFVQIYTTFTSQGNMFYILTISPFEKRQEYRQTFHLILNSINF